MTNIGAGGKQVEPGNIAKTENSWEHPWKQKGFGLAKGSLEKMEFSEPECPNLLVLLKLPRPAEQGVSALTTTTDQKDPHQSWGQGSCDSPLGE